MDIMTYMVDQSRPRRKGQHFPFWVDEVMMIFSGFFSEVCTGGYNLTVHFERFVAWFCSSHILIMFLTSNKKKDDYDESNLHVFERHRWLGQQSR